MQMKFPPLLAMSLTAIPLPVVARATRLMFSSVMKAHPGIFDRLGAHAEKRYLFMPADLPFTFLIVPAGRMIEVARRTTRQEADATIEGPLFLLLAVLEGRYDADALFFSRDVTVTGDMEAMLALRNALDDCDIDLPVDLAAVAGPFGPFVSRTAGYVREKALSGEGRRWN